jgi:hypothetical protein
MAFRKEMFEEYGMVRTDLGPGPNQDIPRPNEDTEFARRLMKDGERLRYEPWGIARHPVLKERLRKEYFLNFWFDYGRASIMELEPRPDIFGIPRYYLMMLKHLVVIFPEKTFRWLFAFNLQKKFYARCLVWRTLGQIVEIYRTYFRA